MSKEEMDRIEKEAENYLYGDGSPDYWNEPVKVYAIHRENGGNVYIQLSGNSAGGELQILQTEDFKQTITMLKSDEITKQLNEKGKAVLNINFDTDKVTLKADGKPAVDEVSKALKSDTNLKIEINGYTDNTGDAAHNLQLSKDRAATVYNTLVNSGIDKSRLSSNGFGDQNPIADNSTEEGKAKNRRVELIKK